MALLVFILLFQFSCEKDQDLLAEAIAPEAPIEDIGEKEGAPKDYIARTVELFPVNDAYLQDNQGYDLTIMRLEENVRTGYIMFDLSDLKGTITNASLQFTIDSDQGDGTINVSKGPAGEWTETDLNDGNAPEGDTYLGTTSNTFKLGETQTVSLSATALTAEKTTLVLTQSTGDDLAFASKENPSKKGPKLVVSYNAPITAESPAEEETPAVDGDQSLDGSAPDTENATAVPVAPPISGAYYVTVNGKATNNGLSEATAWNIEHAFGMAKAGDVVYIKAGNYGNKRLKADNSGLADQPIKFIGYTNTPGDIVAQNGSTFRYGEQVNASKMPLIQGVRTNNVGVGTGLVIQDSNIQLSNFQIRYYSTGLLSIGNNNVLDNIVVTDVGDFSAIRYNGVGISVSGNNVTLKNSVVVNAGAEGIHVKRGTNQTHSYNKVYCNNTVNPCDYYYLFSIDSHSNKIDNALVYRENGLSHYGHGLICKENASSNVFTNFQVINTFLELSFDGVRDNLFENGVIQGSFNRVERKNRPGGILIANGAHHNTLKNIKVSNVEAIISFSDWVDGTKSPFDANNAGNNNTFTNITAEEAEIAINFDEFSKLEGVAHDNIIQNSSFKNIDRLFQVNRPNSNNKLQGCTLENIGRFQKTSSSYNYLLNSNTIFSSITKINLSFLFP